MNQLQVINHNNQRVLTTAQLADSFDSTPDKVSYNFNYNSERYKEGKHYFLLADEELKTFKMANREFQGSINKLYLWTEKGAWMHAKSLNTDQAWEAYEMLIDDYYKVKEIPRVDTEGLSPLLMQLIQTEQRLLENERSTKQLQDQVTTLATGLTATPEHTKVVQRVNELARWSRIGHNEVYNKIYDVLKARFSIDVKRRVENERERIDLEYFERTGKHYSQTTLKGKMNGIDVMVRMGALDKFNEILVGMLATVKKTG